MSTELAALEEISKLLGDKKPEKPKKDEPAPPIRPLFTVSDLQALKQNEVIFNRFRSMPFKTKLTPNWQIDWGKKYEDMGYTTRPRREIKVFDLKGFVTKLKGDQPTGMPGMPGMGGMGMPGMPGMPISGGYVPGGMRSQPMMSTSLDEYVKKLDEQIAKLEKEQEEEEKREKERLASASKVESEIEKTTPKTEEEISKEINDIFEHKVDTTVENKEDKKSFIVPEDNEVEEEVPPLHKDEDIIINKPSPIVEVKDDDEEEFRANPTSGVRQEPTYDNVEKPKVNIDVDSVVVNNHTNNEDFFDDFFGGEDE
jgi:hypothetical protein